VAVGSGVPGLALGMWVIVAVVLSVALAALWRAYFDLVMLTAERRFSAAGGR
jgi:hypothetical protein